MLRRFDWLSAPPYALLALAKIAVVIWLFVAGSGCCVSCILFLGSPMADAASCFSGGTLLLIVFNPVKVLGECCALVGFPEVVGALV